MLLEADPMQTRCIYGSSYPRSTDRQADFLSVTVHDHVADCMIEMMKIQAEADQ